MRESTITVLLWTATALGTPTAVRAQSAPADPAPVARGAMVRVLPAAPGARWHTGRLRAFTADSIALRRCRECADEAFARADLRAGLVRRGLPGSRGLHTVAGVGAGALLGAAAVAVSVHRCEAADRRRSHAGAGEGPPCGIGYIVLPLGVAAGTVVGGLVGAMLPTERWRRWSPGPAGR